jgi:hypothetical protein
VFAHYYTAKTCSQKKKDFLLLPLLGKKSEVAQFLYKYVLLFLDNTSKEKQKMFFWRGHTKKILIKISAKILQKYVKQIFFTSKTENKWSVYIPGDNTNSK